MPITIDKGSNYFRIKTYTGDGTSGRSITFDETTNMQPDFVWYKSRSNAYNHGLFDVIRGTTKFLSSNQTQEEITVSGVTAFNSNGFTVGTDAGSNGTGATFVAWNWKANGAGVSNTQGSITSTVSANTTSGFSIVSYTGNGTNGATIGHGLGVTPKMFIIKERTDVNNWVVYHSSVDVTGDYTLRLDLTDAKANGNNTNNDTAPTSSLITLGTSSLTNGSSKTYIMYCFSAIKGYSAFGSYTGNGSTDGTFVYTGFKPKFFLAKRTDTTNSWTITNSNNQSYNQADTFLNADSSQAESTATSVDYLSNGIKIRSTGAWGNASGGTYIYMAFAENPFVTSKGIPTTAR